MTPSDWAEITYFSPNEFAVPEKLGYEFVKWLDGVRERAGVPMHITSSYRTPEHNREVGGAADSAHCDDLCEAVDIAAGPTAASDPHWDHARFAILRAAIEAGCVRVGMYPAGSLHLDRTEGRRPSEVCWMAVAHRA